MGAFVDGGGAGGRGGGCGVLGRATETGVDGRGGNSSRPWAARGGCGVTGACGVSARASTEAGAAGTGGNGADGAAALAVDGRAVVPLARGSASGRATGSGADARC